MLKLHFFHTWLKVPWRFGLDIEDGMFLSISQLVYTDALTRHITIFSIIFSNL